MSLALVIPLGVAPLAHAQPGGLGRPDVSAQRVSKVKAVTGLGAKRARARVAKDRKTNAELARRATAERKSSWPKPGRASLDLTAGKAVMEKAGGLPVTLAAVQARSKGKPPTVAAGTAQVKVLDQKAAQKAGVTGVLLTAVAEKAGQAQVRIDYSSFAGALGGGWAGRLRLVELPDCALTTPEKEGCRTRTPVKSVNDAGAHTVTGTVALVQGSGSGVSTQTVGGTTVLALTAAASGGSSASGESPAGTGNYSATNLSSSSAWQAGGSSGAFTWSYGFAVPPAAEGPTPSLSLSYDSGSTDGETATTNNQGTTVGEGFGLTESYITRQYGSCDDDGHADISDECWKYDNARLVLNGKSSRLVKDDDSGQWRLEGDDASRVTRSTGADNGDDDGEYWTVTTGDGTQYVFGLNKLEGATTQRTNSVWTVPVFGDDSGEPGYSKGDTFADRALTQAWRWNLDYVVDTQGNAATYWYAKESNYYKKNKEKTAGTSYTRGGYLTEIKYGLRKGALFTDDADARVSLSYAERCTASDCSSLTKDTADNWPDVPFDAICSKDDTDCDASGPSFFTRKRLTDINTSSWAAGTKTYVPVDSWKLDEQYLDGGDIGDSSDQALTLKSITRTGKAGDTAVTLKPVSFTYQMRPNRVDATDDILPLTRPRISTVTSETGGITTVTLSEPECKRSEVLDAPQDTNTRSCYPQFWHINGAKDAAVDWFNKYRVEDVVTSDPTGNNEAVENSYSYTGAAWHYNDDPFTPKDERTWSDWRGYAQVTSYTGALNSTRSKTVSLYMQGMDGDKKKDGTTRVVTVAPLSSPDLGIAGSKDSDQFAGQVREQITYNGATSISATMNDPWSKETARQSPPDAGDHVARYVRTKGTTTYTYLTTSKTWRSRTVSTAYDSYGMPYLVADSGQIGKGGDQTCARTWYARNTTVGITALVSRERTVSETCSVDETTLSMPTTSATRGDVISDTATVYDTAGATGWSASQSPSKGQVTWTGRAIGYAATAGADGLRAPTGWQTVTTTTYDPLGRPQSVTDGEGHTTSTDYIPAGTGPLTQTITTDAKGYRAITFLDPRRGLPLRSYDINQKKTEQAYDGLGRLTQVWLPNRIRGSQAPSSTFVYHLDNTAPSWVSSGSLKKDGDTYNTTYALYDSLLRPLQTQSPTPQGGRLLTDTRYDSRGLAYETYADVFDNTSTPNGTYTRAEYGQTPNQTETVFDGAGRPTTSTLLTYGEKKWSTTTSYTGDSTASTALQGGSATRTITDVRGQTVESRAYAGSSPADKDFGGALGASYTSTKVTYGADGQQLSLSGPDGAKWSYGYDLFGRQVSADDPDKGRTTTVYDTLDQAVKSTDSRGKSILTTYDEMGRSTGTWDGTKDDAHQLTGYTYDSVLKGQPDSSIRYVGGRTGQAYSTTVTDYDSLSRPTDSQLTLPASDPFVKAGEPSTLKYEVHYNIDGSLQQNKEPALGGLPSEIVDYTYDELGDVTGVGGATGYLRDVDYSALAQPQLLTLGTGGTGNKNVYVADTYEEGTGRLTRSSVTDQTHPYMLQDLNYSHDQTGNVTAISDPTTLGGTSSAETQCFSYDGHQRLTEAWTPTAQKCDTAASAGTLSGPAPYWNSYTYTQSGQRESETVHKTAGDTKTTYCYTGTHPHTLTGTTTKTDCTKPESAYSYDKAGNTTSRPGHEAAQSLAWSDEGKLAKVTESGKATDYLYDADGNLLIRTTQDGERVLYAGATELHLRADGTTWAQRYYSAGGTPVAVRTNQSGTDKLCYLAGDNHNTSSLAVTSDSTQAVTKRHMDPFGAERGKPTGQQWPDDKGFLGKTDDTTTGLTHIGAREYDATIGQFISADPLLSLDQPQSLNGYNYANDNPVSGSDPSGLGACMQGGPCGGVASIQDWAKHDKKLNPQNYDGKDDSWSGGSGGGGTYHGGSTTFTSPGELISLLPRNMGPDRLNQIWVQYGYSSTGGGGYWDAPVGDGDRTAMACFGRTACQKAATIWMNTHDLAKAKYAAATYCVYHVKRCGIDEGAYDSMKSTAEAVPILLAGEAASALRGIRRGANPCNHSFVSGTEVELADSGKKEIQEVKVGDRVTATDPKTGKTTVRKVTAAIVTKDDKEFVDLTVKNKKGEAGAVVATVTHPFWVASAHKWVDAGRLEPGMVLQTLKGKLATLTAVRHFTKLQRTYDLTVSSVHTYYVLAGTTPILVHNCNLKPGEQYVYRAVQDKELQQIATTRRYENIPGIESKYFSSTPEGAAAYAKAAFAKFPQEGAYTLTRGVIRSDAIPMESRIEHLADGGGGIDAFALWEDSMSTIGRVRMLPSMPIP